MSATAIALLMLDPAGAVAGTAIRAPFLGRYEADARDCLIPMPTRDDDETGQGGSLVLVRPHLVHFVQWDWPVRSAEVVGPNEIKVRLLNDVDADGKNIVVARYSLKRAGRLLVMTQKEGSQSYYRCGAGR